MILLKTSLLIFSVNYLSISASQSNGRKSLASIQEDEARPAEQLVHLGERSSTGEEESRK